MPIMAGSNKPDKMGSDIESEMKFYILRQAKIEEVNRGENIFKRR